MPLREHGFGAEVKAALTARKEWLLSQQFPTRAPDGGVTPKPGLVADLINRDLDRSRRASSNRRGHHRGVRCRTRWSAAVTSSNRTPDHEARRFALRRRHHHGPVETSPRAPPRSRDHGSFPWKNDRAVARKGPRIVAITVNQPNVLGPPPAYGRRPALSRGKLAARPSPAWPEAAVSALRVTVGRPER
jgi:hypothetical protein